MHAQLACPLMQIQYCTEDHFSVNALLEYLSVLYSECSIRYIPTNKSSCFYIIGMQFITMVIPILAYGVGILALRMLKCSIPDKPTMLVLLLSMSGSDTSSQL